MNPTKQLIFQTATKLFVEKGYDQVTITDICEGCNITKSTFYYHVASKQDIIVHQYDELVNNIQPILIDMFTSNDYIHQLRLLFKGLAENIVATGIEFNKQALIISLRENLRTFDIREEIRRVGESIIKKGQEAGQFTQKTSAQQLFESCCYLFFGYEVKWTLDNGNLEWIQEFERSMDLLLSNH